MNEKDHDERDSGDWPTRNLPTSWSWVPFDAAFSNETTSDRKLAQSHYRTEGALAVVDQGQLLVAGYTDEHALQHPSSLPVVVFGDHTRCVKFVDFPFVQGADGVKVLRPTKAYDPKFAFHALRTVALPNRGYSRHYKFLAATHFPLAPLNEQRRIVAKLASLQARSRRAREALDAVPPLLEKLRQSILAAAFRGDLTKDWRAKHPRVSPTDLSATDDLHRQPKKRLWGSGHTADGVDPSWGALPDTWQWARVRDLNEQSGVAVQIGPMSMKSSEFVTEGTSVLNVGCVQRGYIDQQKADYLPESRAKDFERYRLLSGDVLFTRSGTVGRCACLPKDLDGALMTFHLLRVRPSSNRCDPAYLMYAFQGSRAVEAQINTSSVGATRAGFNTRLLEEMWIPLAPREEQKALLSRVSEYMAMLNNLQRGLEQTQLSVVEADRSLLSRAFRGELVPHDPSDEPAEALLARGCGNERSPTLAKSKPRGRRTKAAE